MSDRLCVSPSPGPLEEYARAFDPLFSKRSQREGFRRYLEGLLLPAERNKTLTAIVNTEPIAGANKPEVQRLQWFLSESTWSVDEVNRKRMELLFHAPSTAPTEKGVLVIDETGDRKWGKKTAHVGKQYLGSIGKVENGVVSVSSLWADERIYHPLEVEPYTPAHWFLKGRSDASFRTKPQIALELVRRAICLPMPFRAVIADSFYGDNFGFVEGLEKLKVKFVVALKPSHCWWHREDEIGCVEEAAGAHPFSKEEPGDWQRLTRTFRDGHRENWWLLEAVHGPYGPEKPNRLIIVTTDPESLADLSTWYLLTNLKEEEPEEIARLYGLRVWVEQSYKQVKQHLGWAQYQVRSDAAMRRHWQMVFCAFSFCWLSGLSDSPNECEQAKGGEGKKTKPPASKLACGSKESEGLARSLHHAVALLARVVGQTPSAKIAKATRMAC